MRIEVRLIKKEMEVRNGKWYLKRSNSLNNKENNLNLK